MASPAPNVTEQALNICSGLIQASEDLMNALERLIVLKDRKEGAGLDLTSNAIEAAIAASGIKHVNGDIMNSVLGSGAAVMAFVKDNFHSTNFDKARP